MNQLETRKLNKQQWVLSVVDSCRTIQQLATAKNLIELYSKDHGRDLQITQLFNLKRRKFNG